METNIKSPLAYARIGGVLYLAIILIGLFNELAVRSRLIVSGDATGTFTNIMASEQLWRISFAGSIVMLMCAVPLALIMYVLLRPVDRNIALLAVFFNLVSIAIEACSDLYLFGSLFPAGTADYLKAFGAEQRYAMAYMTLRMHTAGYNISLVFFGMNCLFWGYLIFKSGYFPKILGLLLILCAGCYVINSFSWFVAPGFAETLVPWILMPCFIAETAICLYLIIKGISVSGFTRLHAK